MASTWLRLLYGYREVLNETISFPQRGKIKFLGGVTVSDNPTDGTTEIEFPTTLLSTATPDPIPDTLALRDGFGYCAFRGVTIPNISGANIIADGESISLKNTSNIETINLNGLTGVITAASLAVTTIPTFSSTSATITTLTSTTGNITTVNSTDVNSDNITADFVTVNNTLDFKLNKSTLLNDVAFTWDPKLSDVATRNYLITPQAPFGSAATNKSPGNVRINFPASTGNSTLAADQGKFQIYRNGFPALNMYVSGVYGSSQSATIESASSLSLLSNASLFVNTAAGANTGLVQLISGVATNNSGSVSFGSGQATAASGGVGLFSGFSGGNSGGVQVNSGSSSGGNTGNVVVTSGTPTSGLSGYVQLITGSTNAVISGGIFVSSGNSLTGGTGQISIVSGNSTTSGLSGAITFRSGTGLNSGFCSLGSGNSTTGASGVTLLSSGDSSGGANTGSVTVRSGGTSAGSGSVTIASGASTAGVTGALNLLSGSTSGNAKSGDVNISSGSSSLNNSGHIIIRSGTADPASGISGDIRIIPGTGLQRGNISFFTNSPAYGSGEFVMFIANCIQTPVLNPSSGVILYASGGNLFCRHNTGLKQLTP